MLEPSYSAWEDYVKLWKTGSTKNFGRESPDKFLQFPPTIPVYPHLLGGAHMPFCPPVEAMHAVTIMSLKAIGLQIIICRHCVDQQTDSLVFTEFHSDHREWSHWKVEEQRPTLAPLHRNLEGHLAFALPALQLVLAFVRVQNRIQVQMHPWMLVETTRATEFEYNTTSLVHVRAFTYGRRKIY